eukprot:Gb_39707 [translate_table: standard]
MLMGSNWKVSKTCNNLGNIMAHLMCDGSVRDGDCSRSAKVLGQRMPQRRSQWVVSMAGDEGRKMKPRGRARGTKGAAKAAPVEGEAGQGRRGERTWLGLKGHDHGCRKDEDATGEKRSQHRHLIEAE